MLAWPRGVITDVHAAFFGPSACPPCCRWQNQKPFCVSEPEMQRRPRGQAWRERAGSGSCGVEGHVPWCMCVGWGDAAAGRTGLSLCCWVIVRQEMRAVPGTHLGTWQVLIFLPSFSFFIFLLDQVSLFFSTLQAQAVG